MNLNLRILSPFVLTVFLIGPNFLHTPWHPPEPLHADSMPCIYGPCELWRNGAAAYIHNREHYSGSGLPDVKLETEVSPESVSLRASASDDTYIYCGSNLQLGDSPGIARIGDEWIGMDHWLTNLPALTWKKALEPDTVRTFNPRNCEPLSRLRSIRTTLFIRPDSAGASATSEGVYYNGELNPGAEELQVKILVDEFPTTLSIPSDKLLTELEISAIKLLVIQRRLWHACGHALGERYQFRIEGSDSIDPKDPRPVVLIELPRIELNNPNLDPFSRIEIRADFDRDPNWKPRYPDDDEDRHSRVKKRKWRK